MTDPVPYFRFEFAQWMGGRISRRPAIEQAVFINAVAMIMRNGGPVVMDDGGILDMADRLQEEPAAITKAIDSLRSRKLIVGDPPTVGIKFLATSMESVRDIREKRKAAGNAGGKANASRFEANASQIKANASSSKASASVCEANRSNASNTNTDANAYSVSDSQELRKPVFTVPMVDPATVPEAQRVYIPPKPPEAVYPAKPYIDPETGSTAGRKPHNEFCVLILANGRIAPGGESAAFRAFMLKYPKPDKRDEAADAWNREMFAGTDPKHIMQALDRDIPEILKREAQFRPRAANWLADRPWVKIEEAAKAKAAKANAPKLSPEEAERIRKEREDQRRRDEEDEQLRREQIAELSKKFRETLAI